MPGFHFAQPAFLFAWLLIIPWIWLKSRGSPFLRGLRVLAAFLLCLGLAQPSMKLGDTPVHLVILVDRSPSMPATTLASLREWLSRSAFKPRPGDEITLIGFGNDSRTEVQSKGSWPGFEDWKYTIEVDRTDLGAAIEKALSILAEKPAGRILLITDGIDQGGSVESAITRASSLGIPIHSRIVSRNNANDLAVEAVEGPSRVRTGQPFIVSARLRASERTEVKYRFLRGDVVLSEGTRELAPGQVVWRFRDVLTNPSLKEYRLEILAEKDAFPENNRGLLLVRAQREKHALVWTQHGEQSLIKRDLLALGFDVETRRPTEPPQSAAELSGARLIVLENAAATELGLAGLGAFRNYVENLGGGLLVTGGKSSFGLGGYHKSPLDPVLPVSMEVRKEQRKAAVALCIALDRSGSMAVDASPGVTKMQLANEGTVAALQLLTPNDLVSVIAVDSAPHVVVPLQLLSNPSEVAGRIRKIQSMGGGIFVRSALEAAVKQLEGSSARTRHIILFSDANDSEEQQGVPELVETMKNKGITVSVIGLGKPTDSDGRFLIGLANHSGGRIEFSESPQALPQIFAKETITILRSTFIEEPVSLLPGPDFARLGPMTRGPWARPAGYNVTYTKPLAGVGLFAEDDQRSPMLAFWQKGRGRVAAVMAPWEGEFAGEWTTWSGRSDFLGQLSTWLTSVHESQMAELRWDRQAEKPRLVLTTGSRSADLTPKIKGLSLIGPDGETISDKAFQRMDDGSGNTEWSVDPEMFESGHYVAIVELQNGEHVVSPPYSVPFPPEFDLTHYRDANAGRLVMERIMERTQGRNLVRFAEIFEERPVGKRAALLLWPWFAAALLVYLLEIALERFGWLSGWSQRVASGVGQKLGRRIEERKKGGREPAAVETGEGASSPFQSGAPSKSNVESSPLHQSGEKEVGVSDPGSVRKGSALKEAKERARRRT